MDSDRRSAQVKRLEVVDRGRRRRWSEDGKLKIVLDELTISAPSRGDGAAVCRFAIIATAMAALVSAGAEGCRPLKRASYQR